jgi:simple sugar transport system substrate-binding protein
VQVPTETAKTKKSTSKLPLLALLVLVIIGVIGIGTYFAFPLITNRIVVNTGIGKAKLCQGVKVAFFPGGNNADSFASVVYNGAKAAEAALGVNVQYFWSDWDSNKMVTQFQDAISTSPDAIAIMGHPGADALSSLVDEAERKNIIVTMQNVDIPSIREKYISNGFGYVGQALYASGLLVSNGVIRKYKPKEGAEAIVFGVDPKTDPARYERTKGEIDGLTAAKLVVHEITMSPDVQKDTKSPVAQKMLGDALAKYPNAKIIILDHGGLTAAAPVFFKNLGKKPGEFIVAGFDLSLDTVSGIKSGYIGLVQDQQPYLQGFLPILQSCLSKKYGFSGLYIDTGVGLIDSSNVDLVANLAKQGIR